MPPFQKYGLLLLAIFVAIVVLTDLFVSVNLNFKDWPNSSFLSPAAVVQSYFASSPDTNSSSSNASDTKVAKPRRKSFKQMFETFPWGDFESVVGRNEEASKSLEYSQLLIKELMYFIQLEPYVPVNASCEPPPLLAPHLINCSHYPEAFGSSALKRTAPARLGVLLQFGFDVDMLEVHLNELYGIVDHFFIIESTFAHYGKLKKPLIWEHVKEQSRFSKFPVTHLIIDDAESAHTTRELWGLESLQERLRWEKFLEWNDATKFFGEDDIIGFGDADEIPSRTKVNLLKYCRLESGVIDFGIWFPFGHINQAFRTDWPVRGHSLTLGDPTYFTLRRAKAESANSHAYPSRKRGRSGPFLLGGTHMTHYGYLPFQLVKRTTATEDGLQSQADVHQIAAYFKNGDMRQMELGFGATPSHYKNRIIAVDYMNSEMREICVLPWFYNCNRERYPVWEERHDTRLD